MIREKSSWQDSALGVQKCVIALCLAASAPCTGWAFLELLADLLCLPIGTAQVPFACFIFCYSLVRQTGKAGLIFI